jgi:hypothetical protein
VTTTLVNSYAIELDQGRRGASVRGGVDRRVLTIEPEALTVPSQASARNRIVSVDLECEFVALEGGVVFAKPFVKETHQAPDFGRFGFDVERPAEVPLRVFELLAVQSLAGKDQVGRILSAKCPSLETANDRVGSASG